MDLECPKCRAAFTPGTRFCVECGTELISPSDKSSQQAMDPGPMDTASVEPVDPERRDPHKSHTTGGGTGQTTALMVDLSGIARISDALGQERIISLMGQCVQAIIRKIHQFEGSVEDVEAYRIVSPSQPQS